MNAGDQSIGGFHGRVLYGSCALCASCRVMRAPGDVVEFVLLGLAGAANSQYHDHVGVAMLGCSRLSCGVMLSFSVVVFVMILLLALLAILPAECCRRRVI